ncbi:unnamed protein product, partial [Discosporangium mesarthrocarpum]
MAAGTRAIAIHLRGFPCGSGLEACGCKEMPPLLSVESVVTMAREVSQAKVRVKGDAPEAEDPEEVPVIARRSRGKSSKRRRLVLEDGAQAPQGRQVRVAERG